MQNQRRKMNQSELDAYLKEQGIELEQADEGIALDEKIKQASEAMGGGPKTDGLDEAQAQLAAQQWQLTVENEIYRTEREIETKYPNASKTDVWEAAKAFMSKDVLGVAEILDKVYQADSEREKLESKNNEDLKVSGDSGEGDGKQPHFGLEGFASTLENANFEDRS